MNPESRLRLRLMLFVCLALGSGRVATAGPDPLPSWKDTPKQSIVAFVKRVTQTPGGCTRRWCISQCWSCSRTCAATGSRRSSCRAVASSSCARGPNASTACRPSRSSVAIESRIGRRPIAAFGNSDGDLQMLEWATAQGDDGARFALLVHHDDAKREYAYDRADKLQKLDKAWDEATARGWSVVSMKSDWATVYPPVK